LLDKLTQESLIVEPSIFFVDDGSPTEPGGLSSAWRARTLASTFEAVRNFGQQSAILAGLLAAPGDALVSIDADLQDDIAAIEEMARDYARGADVVYGIRRTRKEDSFFKRTTAEGYYRLLQAMGVELNSITPTFAS